MLRAGRKFDTESIMPFTIPPYTPESIADWEGRYHILFERSELFMQKLCGLLEMPYEATSENEILEKVKSLNHPNKSKKVRRLKNESFR